MSGEGETTTYDAQGDAAFSWPVRYAAQESTNELMESEDGAARTLTAGV